MERNVCLEEGAVFLAHEVAVPVRVAVVEDRDHVYVEPGPLERNGDAVGLRLDLIGAEIGKGLAQPLGEVLKECGNVCRRVGAR